MSERLRASRPIYPLISILSAVAIIVIGLITAKSSICLIFLAAVWLLFIVFGYWKAALMVLPFAAVCCIILGGITYLISKDMHASVSAAGRILAVCVAVIPGLAMQPIDMVRCFSALHLPRMLTLAMMITLAFFPLLFSEVRQIREAMQTRGAGNLFAPKIFYRAFLIPLMMRLINISDTLALSVETRGFTAAGEYTVYKTVPVRARDIVFAALLAACAAFAVLLFVW